MGVMLRDKDALPGLGHNCQQTMGFGRSFARNVMLPICRQSALLREVTAYIDGQLGASGYEVLRDRFIENGQRSRWNAHARQTIATKLARIHDNVETHSTPVDSLIVAEAALSVSAEGDIVECGCYKGGSTSVLSIIAKLLGKRVIVFDSFEGLPTVSPDEEVDYQARDSRSCTWKPGANRGSIDEVTSNVRRFGELDACSFRPGWFADTLTDENLPASICLTFTDVVLATSVRQCARALWPRLTTGGVYFSRDVALTKALQSLCAPDLWHELDALPPVLFGGGYGLNDAAPHLGYMVKGNELTPEYLDSLRVYKPDPPSQGIRYTSSA
jgi:O-methyltransferase